MNKTNSSFILKTGLLTSKTKIMKKVLFILLLSATSLFTFAAEGKASLPAKKEVKIKTIKKLKPYPVSGTLSCGYNYTFNSSCGGSVAECIPSWNAAFAAAEAQYCNN